MIQINSTYLRHFKEQLFDFSRRNRLLFFKPLAKYVNVSEVIQKSQSDVIINEQNWELNSEIEGFQEILFSQCLQLTREEQKIVQEYGCHSLKLAFGFISFDVVEKKEVVSVYAPFFLIPITIKLERAHHKINIASESSDWSINPILRFYLKSKWQLELPESIDVANKTIYQVYQEIQKLLKNVIQINDFEGFVKAFLGNFNYRNIWMVEDYEKLIQSKQIVSVLKSSEKQIVVKSKATIFPILPFDSSQLDVLFRTNFGNSWVIKGPPGTGKSQTIANLMSTMVAQGKRVLFVSEKKQAGQVLFNRLKSCNLSDLCLLIYDAKEDKKSIQESLKKVYQKALNKDVFFELKSNARDEILVNFDNEMLKMESIFNGYKEKISPDISFIKFLSDIEIDLNVDAINYVPSIEDWERYRAYFQELLLSKIPAHFFKKWIEFGNFSSESVYVFTIEEIEKTKSFINEFEAYAFLENIGAIRGFFVDFELLIPYYLQNKIELFDPKNKKYSLIKKQFLQLQKLEKTLSLKEKINQDWKEKWSKQACGEAIVIIQKWQNSFLKSIHPTYKKTISRLKKSYRFDKEVSDEFCLKILKNLENEWNAREKYNEKKSHFEQIYPFGNFNLLIEIIEKFNEKEPSYALDFLLKNSIKQPEIERILRLKSNFQELEMNWLKKIKNFDSLSLLNILDYQNQTFENQVEMKEFYSSIQLLKNAPFAIQKLLEKIPFDLQEMSNQIFKAHLERFFAYHLDLKNWDGEKQMNTIERLSVVYQEFLEINSEFVASKHLSEIQELLYFKDLKDSKTSKIDFELQTEMQQGWEILENEFKKKQRQKPIRELLGSSAGSIIKKMKPIWLMNPSSVSEVLPLESNYFDVVIFDEASQLKPENSMLSCFRGAQILIVGDEMQMPPSPFFQTQNSSFDNLPNNLLDWGLENLPSQLLNWHYRSDYEALIHFSNEHFYHKKLITTPESLLPNNPPIQMHYLPYGVYENRQNREEASFICEVLEKHLASKKNESIAIIALSQEQQALIEKTIEEKANKDISFAVLYQKALQEKEPLLIKNLENIQGEERDCVIISTCFGPTAKGKVKLHLGPINRKGGEKRLNVLFSRARKKIELVTSITSEHLSFSSNKGIQLLSQFLDFAKNNKIESASTQFQSLPIIEEIINFLTQKGYEVLQNVGFSEFKIPIAIKDANQKFKACIWIDTVSTYESDSAWDEYFFKPFLLKFKGWNTVFVYSKDWRTNTDNCKKYIIEAIEKRLEYENTDSLKMYLQKLSKIPLSIPNNDCRFFYILESQSKFVEYTIDGLQLTLKKGMIDKKSKKQIFEFENEEKLQKNLQRKIKALEKLGFERIFI